ncbi:MAG: aminotransferase class I/II-fold pyridoxal phosphate-dependent enzyme [Cyclobacteriaceae bacterium]|nr:aminotransferase class I/II-fold pyridoxal phosphate-dependent enzyme [Cyclobacteriaceae bacterium]
MIEKGKIWLSPPHMGGREQWYINQAFETNWISTVGPQINAFEKLLAHFIGTENSAVLGSGTAAIHLALRILGVEHGDSVICQSFTFAGSANPIVYQGAAPIFIDSERETLNMDPDILEDALKQIDHSKQPLPKAIIPVHLYGMPAKMIEINSIAAQYNIPVIEDAAEALGSKLNGKMAGSMGAMGVLSFNGNKIITTSGGGALLSNNKNYIDEVRFLATQARDNAPHYQHTQIGYNYRMGNINAAVGLGQMEVLEERIKQKREVFNYYQDSLNRVEGIEFIEEPSGYFSNRWLTTILTKSYEQRETIRLTLEKENIESRPLWKPMHLQPVFKNARYFGGEVSEEIFNRGLCLPSGTALNKEELNKIVTIILQL